jgi:threonine 3-dehydrogenase
MQAIRKLAASPGFAIADVASPSPKPGEVLIAVEAAGLCGTDLHIADWTPGYEGMTAHMPVTLGHEFAGRVLAGSSAFVGRRVVVRPSTVCAECEDCASARHDRCNKRRGIGIHRNGGFASLAVAPEENCLVVDEALDPEIAALTEPLTVAMEAIRRSGLEEGERLLIIGPGPIGALAALAAAELSPATVVVAGRNDDHRLATLRSLGLTHVFDTAEQDLAARLLSAGVPRQFERVIEAAGSTEAIMLGLRHLAPGGVLTVAGIHGRTVDVDLTALVRASQEIRGSYRAPVTLWPMAIELLQRKPERFRRLITHRLQLQKADEAFAVMRRREAMKVIFTPKAQAS